MLYEYNKIIEKVNPEWLPFFEENKEEFEKILNTLNNYKDKKIYPYPKDLLRSLFYYPPNEIKVLIVGMDPYISEENNVPQAMGLSFSVPKSYRLIPPSLKNIFKEIKNSYPDYKIPIHGSLKRWAKKEKILLLNASLTVFEKESNSHSKLWTPFTNKLIKWFSNKNTGCVFLLMGNLAKGKEEFIDEKKHKVFVTVHPSPLSASRGFLGCNVFKDINKYLKTKGIDEIKY